MFVEAKFIEPIADGPLGLRVTFAPATLTPSSPACWRAPGP